MPSVKRPEIRHIPYNLLMRAPLAVLALALIACTAEDGEDGQSATGGTSSGGAAGAGATGGTTTTGGTAGAATGGAGGSGGSAGSSGPYDCKNPHPSWLLCEDFENMSAGFSAWLAGSPWTENIGGDNPGRMTSSSEAHGGSFSLYMPADASAGYKGADLMFRTCAGANQPGCTLKGYDELHFRAWFKLAPDHQRTHHFLAIGGSQSYWDAYGNAGCRPDGARHMGTTVDFKPLTHATFFYTYFPAMKCDPGTTCAKYADPQAICDGCAQKNMPCSNGLECCWGNNFSPPTQVVLPLDQWVCLDMSMKANDVGQANGRMAYSIDGALAHEITDMVWRDTADLKLNMVRLQHYNETADVQSHSNRIWFDDVVVSTAPIGCK